VKRSTGSRSLPKVGAVTGFARLGVQQHRLGHGARSPRTPAAVVVEDGRHAAT
jgi:hypothetical protein